MNVSTIQILPKSTTIPAVDINGIEGSCQPKRWLVSPSSTGTRRFWGNSYRLSFLNIKTLRTTTNYQLPITNYL
ncbi:MULTISPECIES: hypothetical protein [unclassified Microcoleus]|uniref:hypothetical protein n=1 Tax=unclassified Microcoleus TaxID=2642155 RepID=UPI001D885E7F|nr:MULTISPECIES: hypothetical protein [unclassified Microcoleus]MCC3473935.1 hypothetical protein [Microcoleus sp. PH2017_13_LAR_U_A]